MRIHKITIVLSELEKEKMQRAADLRGLALSSYMRAASIDCANGDIRKDSESFDPQMKNAVLEFLDPSRKVKR